LAKLVDNGNQADLVITELNNTLNYWVSTRTLNQLIKNVTHFNTETFTLLKTLSNQSSEDYWTFKNEYDNWQK
jgi:hypothetical protein